MPAVSPATSLNEGGAERVFSSDEVEQAEHLAKDLADLRELGEAVSKDLASGYFNASIVDRIAKWLLKVREVAGVYKAVDYTITLGMPIGISVSFTWSQKD